MLEPLTDEQHAELDTLILAGSLISGIAYIKKHCEISLPDARNLFKARYHRLRAERGSSFSCGDRQYWSCYGEDVFDAIAKGW